jgi:hypothetical protein
MENLAHQFWKVFQIFIGFLSSFLDLILEIPEISLKIVQFEHALVDEVFLRAIHIIEAKRCEPEHLGDHHFLILSILLVLFFAFDFVGF